MTAKQFLNHPTKHCRIVLLIHFLIYFLYYLKQHVVFMYLFLVLYWEVSKWEKEKRKDEARSKVSKPNTSHKANLVTNKREKQVRDASMPGELPFVDCGFCFKLPSRLCQTKEDRIQETLYSKIKEKTTTCSRKADGMGQPEFTF